VVFYIKQKYVSCSRLKENELARHEIVKLSLDKAADFCADAFLYTVRMLLIIFLWFNSLQ